MGWKTLEDTKATTLGDAEGQRLQVTGLLTRIKTEQGENKKGQ